MYSIISPLDSQRLGLAEYSIFRRWITYNLKERNNVDHLRSVEYHLSCNCDFVVRYNNIQRANAKIAGNGDHTNPAVAPTKAYR